jgi:hypothetical protein
VEKSVDTGQDFRALFFDEIAGYSGQQERPVPNDLFFHWTFKISCNCSNERSVLGPVLFDDHINIVVHKISHVWTIR